MSLQLAFVCLCELTISMAGVVIILCQTTPKQWYRYCLNPMLYFPVSPPWGIYRA